MKKGKSRGKFCPYEVKNGSLNLHFLTSAVANLLYISELPVLYENTNVHWTVGDVGRSNTLLMGTLIGTIEENNLAISF